MSHGHQRPTIGRIVHFVLPSGYHRPATVVAESCSDTGELGEYPNLLVALDGAHDLGEDSLHRMGATTLNGFHLWATSVQHDEHEKKPGTWHWPERKE